MADQETKVTLKGKDDTGSMFKSATKNAQDYIKQLEKILELNKSQTRILQVQATRQHRDYKDMLEDILKHNKAYNENLERIKALQAAHGANANAASSAAGKINEALAGVLKSHLSIIGAVEASRRAYLGFAESENKLILLQNATKMSTEELKKFETQVRGTSQATQTSFEETVDSVNKLRTGLGVTMQEAQAMQGRLAIVAKGAGSGVMDMAKIATDMMRNMKIPAQDMSQSLEMLAAAAREGGVEISGMKDRGAELGEVAASMGYKGTQGLAPFLAMLGEATDVMGDTQRGVSLLRSTLNQLGSDQMGEALGRPGIVWREELENVKRQGGDTAKYVIGELKKVRDKEAVYAGMDIKERLFLRKQVEDETGALDKKTAAIAAAAKGNQAVTDGIRQMTGTLGGVESMTVAVKHLTDEFGNLMKTLGVPEVINKFTEELESLGKVVKWVDQLMSALQGKGPMPSFDPRGPYYEQNKGKVNIGTAVSGATRGMSGQDATENMKKRIEEQAKIAPVTPPVGMNLGPTVPNFVPPAYVPLAKPMSYQGGGAPAYSGMVQPASYGGGGPGVPVGATAPGARSALMGLTGQGSEQADQRYGSSTDAKYLTAAYHPGETMPGGGGGGGGGGGATAGPGSYGGGTDYGRNKPIRRGPGGPESPESPEAPAETPEQKAAREPAPGAEGPVAPPPGAPGGGAVPAAGPGEQGPGVQQPDIREGTAAGRTAPAGAPIARSGLATVTDASGRKFQVDQRFAANFQGFINDYEKAGGKLGPDTGTLGAREANRSGHPIGSAIDINQIGYGVRSRKGRGVTLDPKVEDELARKWGLVSGHTWHKPDTGHFGIRDVKTAREALRKNREAAQQATNAPATEPTPVYDAQGNITGWKGPAAGPVAATAASEKPAAGAAPAAGPAVNAPKGAYSNTGADFYQRALSQVSKSGLVGTIPPDGARFGIKTGSAEEWAKFMTSVANEESGYSSKVSNPYDKGGSHGVLQYAHNQVDTGNAHDADASIRAFIRDAKASSKVGLGKGILGRRFATIGNHPERAIRSLKNAEQAAREASRAYPQTAAAPAPKVAEKPAPAPAPVAAKKAAPEEPINLAEGGIVTRPTNANIGEDGAEAVVPLPPGLDWSKYNQPTGEARSTTSAPSEKMQEALQAGLTSLSRDKDNYRARELSSKIMGIYMASPFAAIPALADLKHHLSEGSLGDAAADAMAVVPGIGQIGSKLSKAATYLRQGVGGSLLKGAKDALFPPAEAAPSSFYSPQGVAPPISTDNSGGSRDVPMSLNMKVNDNEVQFARTSLRRQADKEVREARWNSYSDIGCA